MRNSHPDYVPKGFHSDRGICLRRQQMKRKNKPSTHNCTGYTQNEHFSDKHLIYYSFLLLIHYIADDMWNVNRRHILTHTQTNTVQVSTHAACKVWWIQTAWNIMNAIYGCRQQAGSSTHNNTTAKLSTTTTKKQSLLRTSTFCSNVLRKN